MRNPYATESRTETPDRTTGFWANVLIGLVSVSVIAANYASATTIPRERWDYFAHVVFLVSPVSLLIHLPIVIALLGKGTPSTQRRWFLVLLLIPVSFAVSISPYFSDNPYEGFSVMNRFFGPHGWMLWTWLIALGVLPFLERISTVRRSRWTMLVLSLTAIGFHIHNAYWVWRICHIAV
jgi:hypothetical protein